MPPGAVQSLFNCWQIWPQSDCRSIHCSAAEVVTGDVVDTAAAVVGAGLAKVVGTTGEGEPCAGAPANVAAGVLEISAAGEASGTAGSGSGVDGTLLA